MFRKNAQVKIMDKNNMDMQMKGSLVGVDAKIFDFVNSMSRDRASLW